MPRGRGCGSRLRNPDGSPAKNVSFSMDLASADATNPMILNDAVPQEGRFSVDPDDQGMTKRWFADDFDDSQWDVIPLGEGWEKTLCRGL